jgi:hypothetical protein
VEVKTHLGVGSVKPGRPGRSTHDPGKPGRDPLDVVSRIGGRGLVLWLSKRVKRVVATGQSCGCQVLLPVLVCHVVV